VLQTFRTPSPSERPTPLYVWGILALKLTNLSCWCVCVLVATLSFGCSHARLSRTSETETTYGHYIQDAYEISLSDRSGILCGSFRPPSEDHGPASDSSVDNPTPGYQYRQHSQAEYSGLECGGYFRYGEGVYTNPAFRPITAQDFSTYIIIGSGNFRTEIGEAGLHLGFSDFMFGEGWLRYGFLFRLGVERYVVISRFIEFDASDPSRVEEWKGRMPLSYVQKVYPLFLYGLGLEGSLGVDPLMLSTSEKWPEILDYFDYGGGVGYALPFEGWALGAYFGYERRNYGREGFVLQTDGWRGTVSIDINYDGI